MIQLETCVWSTWIRAAIEYIICPIRISLALALNTEGLLKRIANVGIATNRGAAGKYSSYQLRHTAATKARKQFNYETAGALLGHSNMSAAAFIQNAIRD
jgi:hypothetical protein